MSAAKKQALLKLHLTQTTQTGTCRCDCTYCGTKASLCNTAPDSKWPNSYWQDASTVVAIAGGSLLTTYWHLQMVLCCLLNQGDSLLWDEYTYSHLVEAMVTPKGYNAIPVPMDDFGMTPEALQQVHLT